MLNRLFCAGLLTLLVFGSPVAKAADAEDEPVASVSAESAPGPVPIVPEDGPVTSTTGTFVYDPSGNVAAIGTNWYIYDPMNRVTTGSVDRFGNVQAQTYTYDVYGNRLSDGTSYPANPLTNRMTGSGAQYDAAGNLTQWQPPGSATVRSYTYDALSTVMREKVTVSGTDKFVVHIYTADDERYWNYRDFGAGTVEMTYSLRDLDANVLREFVELSSPSGSSWAARDYVHRDSALLASYDTSSGDTLHYSLDHLGTPRMVTDEDHVKLAEHTYFPFGAEYTDGSPTDGRLRFTGHEERDPDFLGQPRGELDYMHARYYSPAAGRFLSPDPVNDVRAITRPQAWNRYAYVMNNPLRYTDPTGLLWFKLDGEWRFVKDANVMQVDTFDKNGKLVSSQMLKGVKFGLVFNGTGLTQLREDGTTRTIPAVSGRVSGWGEVHPEQQGDRIRGPIPEGQYSFNRSDIQTMGAGDQALGLFKRGAWPGSAFAWGKQRAFLTPSPGTNTRGRSGFSIHGGVQPGSAGCIDLCDMVSVFFSEIPADAETIPVDVDYSNPFPKP